MPGQASLRFAGLVVSISGMCGAAAGDELAEEAPLSVDLFVSRTDGVFECRIPALTVTKKGTLIAVCDGRMRRCGDLPNDIDVVMKRSTDGGKTWSALKTIRDFPDWEGGGDPALLSDRDTGTVWCAYDYGVPASAKHRRRMISLHLIRSDDDGETWSRSTDVTELLKPAGYDYIVVGPGAGVQLRDGTLVFPTYLRRVDDEYCCQLLYSKDHGRSWQLGPNTGVGANEPTLVELADGRLMLNMRTAKRVGCRLVAVSDGLDKPWSKLAEDRTLVASGCMASFFRYSAKRDGASRDRLLFSNTAHASARKNLVVRVSYDEGKSWPVSKVIEPGPAAYSCLAVLPDGSIALLYEGEHNRKDGVKKIVFTRFSLAWLTDGKDSVR